MSVSAPDIQYAIGLEPKDAVAHLAAKGAKVTQGWQSWLDGQHAQSFTVANVAKLDVLTEIQASLKKALQQGQTLEQWKTGLIPELQRKGWWKREGSTAQLKQAGRVDAQGEIAKGLTPHRLKTIFQTNMQQAYMAGRQAQMIEQAEERPYWQYLAILDSKTRPAHRALAGKVFRYDDSGWGSFFPPNGFNCRCRVRNFNEREITQRKLDVGSTEGKLRKTEVQLKGGGTAQVTRLMDKSLPGGGFTPDAGFSNNPGALAWQPRLGAADVQLSRQYVDTAIAGPAFERFVKAGGQQAGAFPVARLRPQDQERLATRAAVVYLSDATLAKQLKAHPELTLEDYRKLPDIIDDGEVLRDKETPANALQSLIFLKQDDFWYRAVVKRTKSGEALFVTSLARLKAEKAMAQMKAKISLGAAGE